MSDAQLRRFEMARFQAAIDAERQRRRLTWPMLANEVNVAFLGTPSIPISVSTLRGMASKSSVTSAVVLQALRWLREAPESFLEGGSGTQPEELLPEPGPGRILRFDTMALFRELDLVRRARALTWKEVAGRLPGFTPSMLTNLAEGPLIGFPRVMLPVQWLERSTVDFVRDHPR